MRRVLSVGECMVELSEIDASTLHVGFSGDTYNTAVYLHRAAAELGVELDVGYLTGIGVDDFSDAMRDAWAAEGIRDRAAVVADRTPGLYVIRTSADGERRFTYWRDRSAASALFLALSWIDLLTEVDVIHLSGVTLQLTSPEVREHLLERLRSLRAAGCWISFDTNYRPAGWPSAEVARRVIDEFCAVATVVLSSGDDERLLRGACDPHEDAHRIAALGAHEVVIREGAGGAYVLARGELEHIPAVVVDRVVDTTAAGDAFTGGYLAARLDDQPPFQAARTGHRAASTVIQHRGAIAPSGVQLVGPPISPRRPDRPSPASTAISPPASS